MGTTEIIIRVAARRYVATLLVDGQVKRASVLDRWPEMAFWAQQIRREWGADIHARLQLHGSDCLPTTLVLARYLDGEGFTVGIETNRRHCPRSPLRLQ